MYIYIKVLLGAIGEPALFPKLFDVLEMMRLPPGIKQAYPPLSSHKRVNGATPEIVDWRENQGKGGHEAVPGGNSCPTALYS